MIKKLLIICAIVSFNCSIVFASSWMINFSDGSASYSNFNVPITLFAEAAADLGLTITWISDDTFVATDSNGISITISGLARGAGSVSAEGASKTILAPVKTSVIRGQVLRTSPSEERSEFVKFEDIKTDVFYNEWEFASLKGRTYGLNASMAVGDLVNEFTATVPLHLTEFDYGTDIYTTGIDGAYRLQVNSRLAVGAHAMALFQFFNSGSMNDTHILSGGPFVSLRIPLGYRVSAAIGFMYEFTKPEDAKNVEQFIPALSVDMDLLPDMRLSMYAIHNMYPHVKDAADYTDIGLEGYWDLGSWYVTLGGKVAVGHEEYDSYQAYLGSRLWF